MLDSIIAQLNNNTIVDFDCPGYCHNKYDVIKLCKGLRNHYKIYKHNSIIKTIDLTCNHLQHYIKYIIPFLKNIPVKTINLSNNNLGEYVKLLVPVLKHNKYLKTIDLSNNNLGEHFKLLVHILKYNNSLLGIRLSHNNISGSNYFLAKQYLERNQHNSIQRCMTLYNIL